MPCTDQGYRGRVHLQYAWAYTQALTQVQILATAWLEETPDLQAQASHWC